MRLLAVLLLFLPLPVSGGAWLQDEGAFFLSLEAVVEDEVQTTSLYAEYGVRPKLTFGVAAWGRRPYRGQARLFLKFPLVRERTYELSGEVSLGADVEDLEIAPIYRAGLSWGRGLRKGWANVDASLTWQNQQTATKVEATYGHTLSSRLKAIGQLRFESDSDTRIEADASLAWQVRPNIALRVGVAQRLGDTPSNKITISTWITGKRKAAGATGSSPWHRSRLLRRITRSSR